MNKCITPKFQPRDVLTSVKSVLVVDELIKKIVYYLFIIYYLVNLLRIATETYSGRVKHQLHTVM